MKIYTIEQLVRLNLVSKITSDGLDGYLIHLHNGEKKKK